jgi:hypothetical protein
MSALHPRLLTLVCWAFALSCSGAMFAQSASPDRNAQTSNSNAAAVASQSADLPDSPGTIWAKSQEPSQESPQQGSTAKPSTEQDQSSPPAEQHQKLQRPVGTAAAEGPKVSGITAARPAGVAIAPAKQRHVRTIVLKVGAILGAGAAIGTVVALSAATPSKPPGAH